MRLGQVAPATTAEADLLDGDDSVWLLNLDQVEPHTGRLLSKQIVDFNQAGNSTNWFDECNVLYSKLRPYLNKVYLPDGKGLCTTELVPLKPNPNLITREYLAHYLRSEKFLRWVNEQIDGAKMPRVSMKIFWNHEISLPPLEEQRRIVAILDKADSLRRKRAQAIALADDFLRATFLDMFGDPVINPKKLPQKPLGELIKLKSGDFLPAQQMASGGEFSVYGGNGINGVHDEFMFLEPRIVIGRVGAYCGAVHVTKPKSWVTDNALLVADYSDELDFGYLAFALKFANLNQYASQSGQPLISAGRLNRVMITIPDQHEQRRFSDLKNALEQLGNKLSVDDLEINSLTKSLAVCFLGQHGSLA